MIKHTVKVLLLMLNHVWVACLICSQINKYFGLSRNCFGCTALLLFLFSFLCCFFSPLFPFFFLFSTSFLRKIRISGFHWTVWVCSFFFVYKSSYILVNENQDYIARQRYLRLPCEIFKRWKFDGVFLGLTQVQSISHRFLFSKKGGFWFVTVNQRDFTFRA